MVEYPQNPLSRLLAIQPESKSVFAAKKRITLLVNLLICLKSLDEAKSLRTRLLEAVVEWLGNCGDFALATDTYRSLKLYDLGTQSANAVLMTRLLGQSIDEVTGIYQSDVEVDDQQIAVGLLIDWIMGNLDRHQMNVRRLTPSGAIAFLDWGGGI